MISEHSETCRACAGDTAGPGGKTETPGYYQGPYKRLRVFLTKHISVSHSWAKCNPRLSLVSSHFYTGALNGSQRLHSHLQMWDQRPEMTIISLNKATNLSWF